MSDPAYHQFKLRLPVDLFQRLEAEAAAANRSVSAEMINRLESSLSAQAQGALVDHSISIALQRQLKDMESLQRKLHNILGTAKKVK